MKVPALPPRTQLPSETGAGAGTKRSPAPARAAANGKRTRELLR